MIAELLHVRHIYLMAGHIQRMVVCYFQDDKDKIWNVVATWSCWWW